MRQASAQRNSQPTLVHVQSEQRVITVKGDTLCFFQQDMQGMKGRDVSESTNCERSGVAAWSSVNVLMEIDFSGTSR